MDTSIPLAVKHPLKQQIGVLWPGVDMDPWDAWESASPIQSICKGGEGPSLAALYAWDGGVGGKTAGVLTQQGFLAVG